MNIKKWTILENITIDRLGFGGVWISKLSNGKVILIKWWLPWSIVDCKVVKNKKDYLETHIVHIHKVDPVLVSETPRCPHFQSPYAHDSELPVHKQWCWWCKRQWISYEKQCSLKEKIVYDAFKITETDRFDFYPIIPSPLQYYYRNKIEFSFGKFMQRKPKERNNSDDNQWFLINEQRNLWFHKQWEFSKVISVDQCHLISSEMHTVFKKIHDDLYNAWLPVYDVKKQNWLLRHVVLREWVRTGQIMVNISLASKYFEEDTKSEQIRKQVLSSWKEDKRFTKVVTTCVLTHNNWLWDNVQWPDATLETIWWPWHIFEWLQFPSVDLIRFQISPFSFFQTNTHWAELLFARAKKMIWTVQWNIIDLYCGSWSIGLSFLRQSVWKHVYWIDIVPSAIEDAQKNAIINGLQAQATFFCGKAEKLLQEWIISNQCFVWNDLIVIDPPRQWLHKEVVKFLWTIKKNHNDHRLLYISCNPVTMARDCLGLMKEWYKIQALQPVDMFPHTHHIETIWLLS